MKNIEEQFSMQFAQIFIVIFAVLIIGFYFLVGTLISDSDKATYNIMFMGIFLSILLMLGIGYFFLKKKENKMLHDINEIDTYVHEIAHEKNYGAILKIEHSLELLRVGVSLKNIVKRLEKKDRKSSKK